MLSRRRTVLSCMMLLLLADPNGPSLTAAIEKCAKYNESRVQAKFSSEVLIPKKPPADTQGVGGSAGVSRREQRRGEAAELHRKQIAHWVAPEHPVRLQSAEDVLRAGNPMAWILKSQRSSSQPK